MSTTSSASSANGGGTGTSDFSASSFMDLASWHSTEQTDVLTAYGINTYKTPELTLNVALILPRANDPTALLESDWGTRQHMLEALGTDVFTTYGASQTAFTDLGNTLAGMGITTIGDPVGASGYVSSAESRTQWVTVNAAQFEQLFGTPLYQGDSAINGKTLFWLGDLTPNSNLGISSVWIDQQVAQAVETLDTNAYTPASGAQSIGNSASSTTIYYPQQWADQYGFPLTGDAAVTGTIGLVEPTVGSAVPGTASFDALLQAYLESAGVENTPDVYVQGEAYQKYAVGFAGERSLDVGVAAAVNPYATVGLYVGAGSNVENALTPSYFTAYQAAFWDTQNNPGVVSSSWYEGMNSTPGSPFYDAYRQLMVDAALRNISLFIASDDGGSGATVANGLANVEYANTSPYAVLVGGTSLTIQDLAASDPTLVPLVQQAAQGDLATLWQLIAGGLVSMPGTGSGTDTLVETVWNTYVLTGSELEPGYAGHNAVVGGVDISEPTPSYQSDFGLTPTASGGGGTGRGVPDVSALAGGNGGYNTPTPDMGLEPEGGYWVGTSAAAPMWASLTLQINTIFADQNLPQLGYMNDLLYIAAVVAPGAFNDVTMGNNTSSYVSGGAYTMAGVDGTVTPTGYGYSASEGYDLTTGLGTPNGLLLARALTTIAHAQYSYDTSPDLLSEAGAGWQSGATQSLLFQASAQGYTAFNLTLGGTGQALYSTASDTYAWTSQFAQQSLQSGFSAELVTTFDGQSQGALYQAVATAGSTIAVSANGSALGTPQATLSNPYGFVDFQSADGTSSVEVARAVAMAQTVDQADDQTAVVRLRQNGMNESSVTFYKVDDYAGTIGGLAPGQAGYAEAAAARAYHTDSGTTAITGAGYGQYSQTEIVGVDSGDLIAMSLSSGGHTYWAFASANEQVSGASVAHLWSYGLNTWGWEDLYGGGDRDYNDLVVQLDFTSATGSEWLV
ncbi:DUF4114 domain-containing protein [Aquabacter sp. P-9]|uniref:DUF4114 domain-containing protein n=1 Tax=Aquabacter sediminis TaxID=3029197 RepID=UPI00237EA7AE|nr:DUF4114 domain-containing protein [Aquabacter sp. P-9]MDE1567695.1 hypothetical protein [Aquabacter sp. P-9]